MAGIFGFFDPYGHLPQNTIELMKAALAGIDRNNCEIERTDVGCIGVINYRGASLIERGSAELSYCVLGKLDDIADVANVTGHQEIAKYCFSSSGGPVHLSRIRGSYAAAILDGSSKSLSLITDHFGSYPLYISEIDGVVYFASQVKCILAALKVKPCFDPISVSMMLSIGEVVENRTMVSGIQTLGSASVFNASLKGSANTKYWTYEYSEDKGSDWNEVLDNTGNALNLAVKRVFGDGEKIAVPLSGGLDSRFILELSNQRGIVPRAYTWGTRHCRDIEYAKETASRLGCPHETFVFDDGYLSEYARLGVWLSEGHIPATNFHVLPYVSHLASEGNNIILDGFAGDGVLGGNFISREWLGNPDIHRAGKAVWNWRRSGFDGGWEAPILAATHEQAMKEFVRVYKQSSGNSSMDKAMSFLIDNRVRRITTCGTELFRSEMIVRQPFMDVDFMDAISHMPHDWRRRHRFYLAVLEKFAPKSAQSRYQRTMLAANAPYWATWSSLALQKGATMIAGKFGYSVFKGRSPSDFPQWFRGALKPFVESLLNSEQTLDRGVVPADLIQLVLSLHMNEKRDMTSQIGAIITIELFARMFLDNLNQSIQDYGDEKMIDRRGV